MRTIAESVMDCFEKTGLSFSQIGDEPIFRTIGKGKSGLLTTYVHADQEHSRIECFTICPLAVPQERMISVFELIARINWKLAVGNFDIDAKDGEIRFRTSICIGNIELDYKTIAHLIFMNLTTVDIFVPAIASVVCSNMSPQEALKMLSKSESNGSDKKASDGQAKGFGGRLGGVMGGSNN